MMKTCSIPSKISASVERKRRAQVNQVFTLLMVVLVIVATVLLAGKLLGLFGGTACAVADTTFSADLATAFDEHAAFGSRDLVRIDTPCDAGELYFIDAEAISVTTGEPTIDAILRGGVRANIFVVIDGVPKEAGYDERIIIARSPSDAVGATPYLIVQEDRGRFEFRTEGFGRRIRVEEA